MRRRFKGNKFFLRYAEMAGLSKIMDDQEFRRLADQALDHLHNRILALADDRFESDFNGGALVIEFEDAPAKFVVSPNAPVKQIWVSANLKSHKLDWDPSLEAFAMPGHGPILADLVAEAISQQIGSKVSL